MKMLFNKTLLVYVLTLFAFFGTGLVLAQEEDENGELVITDSFDFQMSGGMLERMEPHGNELMGDMIDKNTGSISFEHTDISIPGNSNLEVALRRKRGQGTYFYTPFQSAFGDWQLDLPIAYFAFGTESNTQYPTFNGGCVENYGNIFKSIRRSSIFASIRFDKSAHIDGTALHIPGAGLSGARSRIERPILTGLRATKNDWFPGGQETDYKGRCAEVAISPNGTKYKFGRHTFRRSNPASANQPWGRRDSAGFPQTGVSTLSIPKVYAVYLVTEVSDVHGNWVRYEYC